MATIVCRRVSFGYDGTERNIFTDLDLLIDTGWRSALAGRNGRGKTTLLHLVHGELSPDRGRIEVPVATRRFPLAVAEPTLRAFDAAKDAAGPYRRWEAEMATLLEGTHDRRTLGSYGALQARFQEAGGYTIDADVERELDALDMGPSLRVRPFNELSGGEQTRCLLAGLFARDDGFPLIDEPTNHLDRGGRALLAEYLRTKPGFLLVSHDRAFLDACVDHVIALNPDTVETRRGSFSTWRAEFRQRIAARERANAELRREIVRLEGAGHERRKGALARESDKGAHMDTGFVGARAARQMKRAIAAERRAERAVEARRETLVDVERSYPLKLDRPDVQGSRPLVMASNLVVARGRPLFAPVSFRLTAGDRLAVLGSNGCGKTSLLDLIAGVPREHHGTFRRDGRMHVVQSTQIARWTRGLLRERLAGAGAEESRFRQIMAALGVRGDLLDRPIESMSPGQRKKIELARSFLTPADLLLWDEPLNFLDIDAREAIEDVVLRDAPTLVFVEHDAAFVDRVATKTVELLPAAR